MQVKKPLGAPGADGVALGHALVKLRFARTQRDLGRRGVARSRAQEARDVLERQLGLEHPLTAEAARLLDELKQPGEPQVCGARWVCAAARSARHLLAGWHWRGGKKPNAA